MADTMDHAVELADLHRDQSLAATLAAAAAIPAGQPGMCEACCDDHPRLVLMGGQMLCAPCRDKREKRR
jgi:RNA polymerase-binding transcription factor DksA